MTENHCRCGCGFDWEAPLITDQYWDSEFHRGHQDRSWMMHDSGPHSSGAHGRVVEGCPARCTHLGCIVEWEMKRK